MLNPLQRRVICFKYFSLIVCVILALGLVACGKKPGHVDPPAGLDHDDFPRIYPDPATDPKPVSSP